MKKKRKLLIIANVTNVHTHKFIEEFKNRNWDLKIISIQPPNIENVEKFKTLIISLPTYKIYRMLIKLPFFKYSEYHNINSGVKLYEPYSITAMFTYLYLLIFIKRYVKEFGPDGIFTIYLTMNGFLAALSGNKNIISSAAGIDVSIHKKLSVKYWLNHPSVLRYAVNRAHKIISFDRKTFEPIFIKKKCGLSNAMWLNHWGINTENFKPRGKDLVENEGICRFICSRPYRSEFDFERILLALKKFHDINANIEFIIATGARSNSNKRGLEKVLSKVNCLGASFITILDHIDYGELPSLISSCDIYIDPINVEKYPQTAAWGVSGSLLEAMSCGLIPVISQRPSIDWILPEEAQPFRYEGDYESLYVAIVNAYNSRTDYALRMKMRKVILEKANWDKNISLIEKEFNV
ncbi:MAG: glycosyltransferase involved in cell wall biosynthesis [Planctomycetota bacterium]|jgi:glycosyltransferase involved in cell wall biosynthesis